MKNLLLGLIAVAALGTASAQSQTIPSVNVKDLEGNTVDLKTVADSGKIIVLSFWATSCAPCIKELEAINEKYDEWKTKYNMKLVAVSMDDARNSKKVKPKVLGYGWTYEVYLDENGDAARAMNTNNPPMTYVLNGKGEVVYSHQGYTPGAEDELEKKLIELRK
ncbi:MAG: TlpA family protein disulfide reductase [Bacteroidetes bacterium]|nr:TlpA family protein disulfide reductase [Bacteroidota bacterium]